MGSKRDFWKDKVSYAETLNRSSTIEFNQAEVQVTTDTLLAHDLDVVDAV